jgi:hypothetical protein
MAVVIAFEQRALGYKHRTMGKTAPLKPTLRSSLERLRASSASPSRLRVKGCGTHYKVWSRGETGYTEGSERAEDQAAARILW